MAVSNPVLRHAQFHVAQSPSLLIEDVALGSASASRAVIVVVSSFGASIGQVDIGGGSTSDVQSQQMWLAIVPEGTEADVEITSVGGDIGAAYVAVYTCDGVDVETPVADDDSVSTEVGTAKIELDVPAGGAVIALGSTGFSSSDANVIDWTGATEGHEHAVDFGSGAYIGYSVASFATETAAPGHAIEIERQDTSFEFGSSLAGIALNPAPAAGFSDIYHGEDQINAIKHGSDDIVAVYYGETKIFEAG